jgi:phosphatidylinositol glycan class P protein
MADERDWALVIPSYLMVIVLLSYWSYAALTPLLSPDFNSPDLIVGESATAPVSMNAELMIR